jgi:hypothetical protein
LGDNKVTKVFAGTGTNATFYSGKCAVGAISEHMPEGEGDIKYAVYIGGGLLCLDEKIALSTAADWSDHVFAEDYHLKPLEEVASFVKISKHLPGLLSAEQLVQEGGIHLEKTLAKHLEKIEELTLYVITLDHEISKFKKKNLYLRAALSSNKLK